MAKHYQWLAFIVVLTAFCIWVSLPDTEGWDWDGDGELNLVVSLPLGLDLVGGARVLLEAQLPPGSFTQEDLERAAENVNRRVNGLGLTEATVQIQGNRRILVELPGVTDRQQAVDTIKATALLEFVDFAGIPGASSLSGQRILTTEQERLLRAREVAPSGDLIRRPDTGQPFTTTLTGADLVTASAQFDPQANEFFISVQLNASAAGTFSGFTASRVGQPMAIVLDGEVLSAPVIQSQLGAEFVIEGGFTQEEATSLALQLRSGALPIPLREEAVTDVGATLGQESVALSVRAGIIGVITVLMFMALYYRVPGLAAALALIVFGLMNFAAYKLIPVTLTLPAITGFLISIGTAVDGNILIFERIKEELRSGKPLGTALDLGFSRAWGSIRDSNISTILICSVLFFFGQTPGASVVSGFAITLIIGLVVNLFTAIIVTRTFLYIFASWFQKPLAEKKWLMGV